MLAMPFAIRADGIFFGTIIITFAGLTAFYGLYLQSRVIKFIPLGEASFFSICQITYPSLSVIFDISIAIKCFGVGVSYLIIIGDLMPQIINSLPFKQLIEIDFLQNRIFWISFSLIFILSPLCYLRNLDSLRYTSFVALIAIGYLVIMIISHFLINDTVPLRGNINYFKIYNLSQLLTTFPIIVFAYTGHQNMFSIINELKDKSSSNIEKIIKTSMSISGFLYLLVGILGYLSFGDNVGENVIAMYEKSISSTIGRCSFILLVLLSYPLMCHPCRLSVNNIIYWIQIKIESKLEKKKIPNGSINHHDNENVTEITQLLPLQSTPITTIKPPLDKIRFITLTTLLLLSSYLTAISVTSLKLVLSLIGATGSTAISFILPGLFGYKLIGSKEDLRIDGINYNGKIPIRKLIIKYTSLGLTIWGCLVSIICLVATIIG